MTKTTSVAMEMVMFPALVVSANLEEWYLIIFAYVDTHTRPFKSFFFHQGFMKLIKSVSKDI